MLSVSWLSNTTQFKQDSYLFIFDCSAFLSFPLRLPFVATSLSFFSLAQKQKLTFSFKQARKQGEALPVTFELE